MRPSEILGLETPWGAYQFDMVCLVAGRKAEKAIANGEQPFATATSTAQFRDPRTVKRLKKGKIKPDGTW